MGAAGAHTDCFYGISEAHFAVLGLLGLLVCIPYLNLIFHSIVCIHKVACVATSYQGYLSLSMTLHVNMINTCTITIKLLKYGFFVDDDEVLVFFLFYHV